MGSMDEHAQTPPREPRSEASPQAPDAGLLRGDTRRREDAPNPVEACSEAAARLKVVIRMLHDDYYQKLRPADASAGDASGVRHAAEGLRDIRDLLTAAAREAERRRAS